MWTKLKALVIASLTGLVILAAIAVIPFIAAGLFILFWIIVAMAIFSFIVHGTYEWLREDRNEDDR